MDSIDAGGGTNIWLGLEQGLNSLKADQMGGRMAHVMLMTNGQTTNRGTLMSNVAEYRQKHQQLPGTLGTCGLVPRLSISRISEKRRIHSLRTVVCWEPFS